MSETGRLGEKKNILSVVLNAKVLIKKVNPLHYFTKCYHFLKQDILGQINLQSVLARDCWQPKDAACVFWKGQLSLKQQPLDGEPAHTLGVLPDGVI